MPTFPTVNNSESVEILDSIPANLMPGASCTTITTNDVQKHQEEEGVQQEVPEAVVLTTTSKVGLFQHT